MTNFTQNKNIKNLKKCSLSLALSTFRCILFWFFLTNVTYILHEAVDDSPPPEVLSHNYRGLYFIFYILPPIWPKELRGKENENLWTIFVQKLEQNDQKCVYFYILANICKGEKKWSPKGGVHNYLSISLRYPRGCAGRGA